MREIRRKMQISVDKNMFLLWKAGVFEGFEGETSQNRVWRRHSQYDNMTIEEGEKDFERRLQSLEN